MTDTITFAISGTINLASALPAITHAMVIDGTTAPGYAGQPRAELNGASAGAGAVGLTVNAGNTTIKGLAVNRFMSASIAANSNANVIQSNWIGLNTQGSGSGTANLDGIDVTGSGNLIGGTTTGAGNVISANNRYGAWIAGTSATGNLLQGKFIGTNVNGTIPASPCRCRSFR